MAADPLAAERAHARIKRALIDGHFRLHARLDVQRIATELNLSSTPVREALAHLSFERLVRFEPKRGYFARLWSEAELRALYEWRAALCVLALAPGAVAPGIDAGLDYPARVRAFMVALAARANPELQIAAANADDRLEAARMVEPTILIDADADLVRLAGKSGGALVRGVRAYHARRMRFAEDIRSAAVLRAVGDNGR